MPAGIFLIQEDGQLVELTESHYESEALLQQLIAQYPSLLAGDQFDENRPRRWLLVKRELGIPGAEGQSGRWSVDHLLLDQDGVPTLVEVKRSTDTRIRREVVGQMLDYAANAVAYWPAERLQLEFESSVRTGGGDPDVVLRDFLGADVDANHFWSNAKTNLQAGRLRMVFVADVIPPELRRIIEFLNQQMDPTEVLGVEIRKFEGGGVRSLVPRVIGQTSEAERRKSVSSSGPAWSEERLFEVLAGRANGEVDIAKRLLDWAKQRGLRIAPGSGGTDGALYFQLDHAGRIQYTIAVRTGTGSGYIQMQFPRMTVPFHAPELQSELRERIRSGTGWTLDNDAKYPRLPLTELSQHGKLEGLLDVLNWIVDLTRSQSEANEA